MAGQSGAKRHTLFAFSDDQSLLATCSADSRVKVWETQSSTLLVDCTAIAASSAGASSEGDGSALLGPFASLAWAAVPRGHSTKDKKKKSAASPAPPADVSTRQILVAGTASGDVVAWDPVGGHVAWRTHRACPEDDVTALTSSPTSLTSALGETAVTGGSPRVWAGTKSGAVCEIEAATGAVVSTLNAGKGPVSSLAVGPGGASLLVGGGGSALKLFDLASRKRTWKVTAHTGPVASCAFFTPGGAHALSSARNERHLALWDLSDSASTTALGTLAALDPIASFSCDSLTHPGATPLKGTPSGASPKGSAKKPKPLLRVLAVTASGQAYLWYAAGVPSLLKSKPTIFRLDGASAPGAGASPGSGKLPKGSVLAGALGPQDTVTLSPQSPHTVTLVRGSVARPRVETVPVGDVTGSGKDSTVDAVGGRTVLLQAGEQGDLVQAGAGPQNDKRGPKGGPRAEAEVSAAYPLPMEMTNGDVMLEGGLGAHARGGDGTGEGEGGKKGKKKKRKAGEGAGEGEGEGEEQGAEGHGSPGAHLGGILSQGGAEGAEGAGDAEETLEEKIQRLGISLGPQSGAQGEPLAGAGGALGVPLGRGAGKGAKGGGGGEMVVGVPQADSLHVLLSQAVLAEDERLVESCLAVEDGALVANTVRRLGPRAALKLLEFLVGRIQTRPMRARGLGPWARALLLSHAALLMASPAAQPLLMALYQEVDARVSLFQPLLSLSGRLDLVASSIREIQRSRRGAESGGESGSGRGAAGEGLPKGAAFYDERNDESDVEVEDATRELMGEEEEDSEEGEEEEEEDEEEDELEDLEGGEEGEGEEREEEEEDESEEEEGEADGTEIEDDDEDED